MKKRHKVEQVKAYLYAIQNSQEYPLHYAVKEEKGCRLARGKLWMGQEEQSIQHVCCLKELKRVRDWENTQMSLSPAMRLCQITQVHTAVTGKLEKPMQK